MKARAGQRSAITSRASANVRVTVASAVISLIEPCCAKAITKLDWVATNVIAARPRRDFTARVSRLLSDSAVSASITARKGR